MICLIAAYSKNRVIGKSGKIPWKLKKEKERFKSLTTGNVVIMGRITYEEIGHQLPDRVNIVVSKNGDAPDLMSAISLAQQKAPGKDIYISGGARLYKEAILSGIVEKMYITEINAEIEGDVFFPQFDETQFTKKVVSHYEEELAYDYVTYSKINIEKKSSDI